MRPRATRSAHDAPPAARERARVAAAARRLALRSRREASGFLAGAWRAAFRGGGLEFEESRPFAPGDDPRSIDWSATARSGEPWVKRFREERDQTLLVLLDVSASMSFAAHGGAKSRLAARTAALLVAAASHARDRVGLLRFDDAVRTEIACERGEAHAMRVLEAVLASRDAGSGRTDLERALARAGPHALGARRGVVALVSDLRDPALLAPGARGFGVLAAIAARHDLVSIVVHDPLEDALPEAGRLRVVDPETPERVLVLDTASASARQRYAEACVARRRTIERRLRNAGADVLWLRTGEDPLRRLRGFFAARALAGASRARMHARGRRR